MKYKVNLDQAVNFAPETETEEILQNVRTILSTRVGSVPLDRDFGMSWEHIDKPYPVAKSLMQAAIIEAIQEYEPRAVVESVTFSDDITDAMEGLLKPTVILSIKDEQEFEE